MTVERRTESVYLIGIGGIGMANVAVLLKKAGFHVSGSDTAVYDPAASILKDAGIDVRTPYSKENTPDDKTAVIVGNALSRGHPEVEAILRMETIPWSFPEFLCRYILPGRHPIVAAGTHGKSTTAACMFHLLKSAGADPGCLIGALPVELKCGAELGGGEHFVIEGDEYDTAFFDKRSKFLHYFPRTLLLGPVEFDHADIFGSIEEIELAFKRLIALLPDNGNLVYDSDNERTRKLAGTALCPAVSIGTTEQADWRLIPEDDKIRFRAPDGTETAVPFHLPGLHNRKNALMAFAAASVLGLPPEKLLKGLTDFRGIRRRLERILDFPGLIVYDDFAHHPTAISSVIQAVRSQHPRSRIIAVFEPRSNTTVRNIFQQDLSESLGRGDEVIVGSVHRSKRIPASERIDLKRLQADIRKAGPPCHMIENPDIVDFLMNNMGKQPSVYLFMSNGSFDGIPDRFVQRLKQELPAGNKV